MIFDNVGGGIALLDSQMAIEGRVDLINNTAVYGGGIATSGRSLVIRACLECGSYNIILLIYLADRDVQQQLPQFRE